MVKCKPINCFDLLIKQLAIKIFEVRIIPAQVDTKNY